MNLMMHGIRYQLFFGLLWPVLTRFLGVSVSLALQRGSVQQKGLV